MNGRGWMEERNIHQCWAAVEKHFYDLWAHGCLWLGAGGAGFLVAAWALPDGIFLAGRLCAAALVLGVGTGILRALGFSPMLQKSPEAFIIMIGGRQCPINLPRKTRYVVYLRLMESGFVLLECMVLLILLGVSTTLATRLPPGIILLVYGFFAVTLAGKSITTAMAWVRWLRPALERSLEWSGADWLLATGDWTTTRLNLLRPVSSHPTTRRRRDIWFLNGLVVLLMMTLVFTITLLAFLSGR